MSNPQNNPLRRQQFEIIEGEVSLPPHPEPADLRDPHWLVSVIPVMGIGVMAIFYLLRATSDSANSALFAVPLLLLAVFTVIGTIIANRWRKRDYARQNTEKTLEYLRLMQNKRARLQSAYDAQKAILEQHFLPVDTMMESVLAPDFQATAKHSADPSFGMFRLGTGNIPLNIKVQTPDLDQHRDRSVRAVRLANEYRYVEDAPVVLSLRDHMPAGIIGERNHILATVRTLICQMIWTHAPSNLQVVVFAPGVQPDDWDWLRWLPHTQEGAWLAFDPDTIRQNLARLSQQLDAHQESNTQYSTDPAHVLVIFDNMTLEASEEAYKFLLTQAGNIPASTINLASNFEQLPVECRTIIEVFDDGTLDCIGTHDNQLQVLGAIADTVSQYDAQLLVRSISAQRVRRTESTGSIPQYTDFLDLYSVETVEQMQRLIHRRWQRDVQENILPFPVPIGREGQAADLFLHLSEEHHGPHGVLAGTTGSGKSELLQTLIASLAIEHHPEWLNFLLIDFKGGSTFNTFKDLPHTAGTVTNLDGVRIRRVLDALKSEIDTRQHRFKQMNVRDIRQYYRFYATGNADFTPLPHLLVIIDEFAQLARDMPDFLTELIRIAQLGRSLGIHLILATQSPMDIITDDINANLQFRICLRVQNIEASRAMLRRPDAAYLPATWVGRGFMQVGERGLFKQFQTAYLGADYRNRSSDSDMTILEIVQLPDKAINLLPDLDSPAEVDYYAEPFTTGHAIVNSIRDYSQRHSITPSKPLLLPPLESRIALGDIFDETITGGWTGSGWQKPSDRTTGTPVPVGNAPVGRIDDVYHREQSPLWVHFTSPDKRLDSKDGHVLIIGSPNSGKTNVLQTLALSQALLHHPDDLHMYFLSFSDASLSNLAQNLPHAERIIHGTESERVRRLFRRLITTLQARETNRREALPRIIVFIDQYEQFRDMYFDQHMGDFDRLLSEGRSAGIFLVLTTSAISSVSERMRSLVQQRIMLRATDPTDYLIGIGAQPKTLEDSMVPGRGLISHNPPLPCQVSLPMLALADDESASAELETLASAMREQYKIEREQTQSPLPLEELPTIIRLTELPQPDPVESIQTTLGFRDDDSLSTFTIDWFKQGPHFVVTGPPASGKTNLLKVVAVCATRQQSPEDLRLILIDLSKRSFTQLAEIKHVAAHITTVEELTALLPVLEAQLARQPQQKTLIMIDNYDMLTEAIGGDTRVIKQLRSIVRNYDADGTVSLWLSSLFEHIGDPLLRHLLMQRCGFAFGSKENLYGFNVRTNTLTNEIMPEGRAFFVQYSTIETVQIAVIRNLTPYIKHINTRRWADSPANPEFTAAPETLHQEPEPPAPPADDDYNVDIDTAGLIEDLFGGRNPNDD